eukprot:CAMPEP_0197197684 /NCGR_PEP_ID=MMETSP1423-20130617/32993_1 /TAXON_ID=476441 /ORGANISM="Pseudo-nitzschia heimii, Strain UNC1101" /LENGTH=990 /DNA_ID=CAMNT_0042651509 /DNA_START=46 /DNA_END=3018 /DNA_ORIENTATION=+
MSASSGDVSDRRGKPRLTRAGTDLDSFPFHKLSVDGAQLAKSIISPLPDPSFAMMRARDPLDLDSTSSTYNSSDEEGLTPPTKKELKIIDENNAESSGGSKSPFAPPRIQQSKKAAFQSAMKSLPSMSGNDPSAESVSALTDSDNLNSDSAITKTSRVVSPSKVSSNVTRLSRAVAGTDRDHSQKMNSDRPRATDEPTRTAESAATKSTSSSTIPHTSSPSSRSKKSANRAIEPEAKHISRIFRKTRSRDSQTDGSRSYENDTYYDVYDSPKAADIYKGSLDDDEPSAQRKDVSKIHFPLSPSKNINDLSLSYKSLSPSGRSCRIDSDGSVHVSPNNQYQRKHFRNEQQQEHVGVQEHSTSRSGEIPIDPDGDIEDTHSTHGESLVPTPDDLEGDYNRSFDSSQAPPSSSGQKNSGRTADSGRTAGSDDNYSVDSEEYSGESSDESSDRSESEDDVETTANPQHSSASTSKPPSMRTSPFPSYRLLVCLAVMIVLVIIVLAVGLTYFLWDKRRIDPIRPPDSDPNGSSPTVLGNIVPSSDIGRLSPLVPTNQELYDIFEDAVGQAAKLNFTLAGKAADWMVHQDPGKALKIRSKDAWIQRYLLVYTYFATTLNRSTSWLSCNPPTENSIPSSDDENSCEYTYPTEIPGGELLYDLVPSKAWLSAADECHWGGISCGVTVTDEITASKADGPNPDRKGVFNLPVTTTMSRSAVTSIVLAGQYLKGSVVTELTALPMLEHLDLSHNGLKGTLSDKFRSLKTLRLQYNEMDKSIPPNFFDDQNAMTELNIGSNNMIGTIPSEVGLVSKMTNLYLFDNNFTGRIPVLGNMPLINFRAQQNQFTGMLPFDYSYGGTWADTLREWWVYDNQLTGSLSDSLAFLTSLEDLRLNNNSLSGSIPASIIDMQRLFRFDVHSNALTGTVPENLGNLSVLRDVRLQFNNLDGVVPTSLCFLESMEVLEADCLPSQASEGDPQTDCYCCTACCKPENKECLYY